MLRSALIATRSGVLVVLLGFSAVGCADAEDISVGRSDSGKTDAKVDGKTDTVGSPDTPIDDTGVTDTGGTVDTGGCTVPAGLKCGVFPQCGCASGEKCDVTGSDGATTCGPDGTLGLNERCDKGGSCSRGYACIGALCRPYCVSDSDCTGAAKGVCHTVTSGTPPKDIPGFQACFTACDPLAPAKNCGKMGCGFLDTTTTTCSAAGTGTGIGACGASAPNNCAPGYVCLSSGDCKKWCRMSGSDCGGAACGKLTFSGGLSPSYGGVEYGVCP